MRGCVLLSNRWQMEHIEGGSEPAYHVGALYSRVLEQAGYELQLIGPENPRRALREALKYVRMVEASDLVVATQGYGCIASFLGRRRGLAAPLIVHTWKLPYAGSDRMSAMMMDAVLERVIRDSALVVFASERQTADARMRYPETRSIFVPVFADTQWWTPGPQGTEILVRLGLHPRRFLLCVGDVYRNERGPARLASVLRIPYIRVTRDQSTARHAEVAIREAGLRDGHCLTNIPVVELRDLYRGAAAVVVAPRESFAPAGLTALTEAMACGAAVLFPSIGTESGYLERDTSGVLFEPDCEESLIAVGRAIVENPEAIARIGRAARIACEKRLSLGAAVDSLTRALVDIRLRVS